MRSQREARSWRWGLAVVAALAVGCGDEKQEEPIDTAPSTWGWTAVPESTCDEGTPTGLGSNLSADSKNLVIYFSGGGACWDATTCLETNSSLHGPFTEFVFNIVKGASFKGSILDRTLARNPYQDWNLFFIPYCTGDLHIGDADQVYTSGAVTRTIRHRGLANTKAFLARIAATVPEPEQVLVTGSSAGGFGAALNYTLIRQAFPRAKVFLVDDAGPLLKNDALSPALRSAWAQAWKSDAALEAIDPAVKEDFSALYPVLARKYPEDRMALLSSLRDETIRGYFQLTPEVFETALRDLATTVIAPLPRTRTFLTPGEGHTLLTQPAAQRSQEVGLLDWLQQMHTASDAEWKSVQP
ncbi:pectinacetylesterase family protein [Stigmatella hybrida]|uniref:pectinacetylesterase family protein n=1 Tax=Stigmatella hybrida TaxID=394097 RepID=UPI001CDAA02C|nr:pectinacetylesterase family protein [Stigmatella hybrida]